MPFESGPQPTTIYVNDNFLPYPATKLIITQYLKAVPSQPWWAWIVVGAFLDVDDNIIWSTEVFVAHLDVELEPESDEEADDDSADEALDAPQGSRPSSPSQSFSSHLFPGCHWASSFLLIFSLSNILQHPYSRSQRSARVLHRNNRRENQAIDPTLGRDYRPLEHLRPPDRALSPSSLPLLTDSGIQPHTPPPTATGSPHSTLPPVVGSTLGSLTTNKPSSAPSPPSRAPRPAMSPSPSSAEPSTSPPPCAAARPARPCGPRIRTACP